MRYFQVIRQSILRFIKGMPLYILHAMWVLPLSAILLVMFANWLIISRSAPHLYNQANALPPNKVGLVLGTVKALPDGRANLYFLYRIRAAVELYNSGKIDHILVSGDNHRKGYDEPSDMRDALIVKGIPEQRIHLDYAGFRTLDSVVRSKEVFGQENITIISQPFHNQRAVFIAQEYGINAVAYNATDVSGRGGFKTTVREWFAKVKAVLDIYLLRTTPKFLGEPVKIG